MANDFWSLIIIWLLCLLFGGICWWRVLLVNRSVKRIFEAEVPVASSLSRRIRIERFLNVDGASTHGLNRFISWQLLFLLLGITASLTIWSTGLIGQLQERVLELPGKGGGILHVVLSFIPWFFGLCIAMMPVLYQRQKRRRWQREIAEDFPVFLEFLVMLSNSGIGFDDALSRTLQQFCVGRPLVELFARFQREIVAGASRQTALEKVRQQALSREIRAFLSALIHATQTGGRINQILQHQASDSMNKRKMRGMEWATGLPIRLLFPMLVCFLPGIWVIGLGPVIHQFLKTIEPTLRTFGG